MPTMKSSRLAREIAELADAQRRLGIMDEAIYRKITAPHLGDGRRSRPAPAANALPHWGQNKSSPKSYARAERNRNDVVDRMCSIRISVDCRRHAPVLISLSGPTRQRFTQVGR